VPNPQHLLKPGLFVTARLALPKSEKTLLVPSAAVLTDSGVSRVFVLSSQRVAERIVALGDRYGDSLEVRSGVAAGERVVVAPDRRLTDGLEVVRPN
jgi:multidrug efflux system membrane fusion protein